MPSPRFTRLPTEKQREILDVAARHFARDGLLGASVARILADCGLTKGVAYYYFLDKDDLFATVFEETWRELQQGAAVDLGALDAAGYWPALRRLYRHQILRFLDRPWLWTLGRRAREVLAHPQHGAALAERLGGPVGAMRGIVALGQSLGVVRDDLPATLLVSMFESLDEGIDAWLAAHPEALQGPEGEALIDRCFASLRDLLLPRGEAAL